MSGMQKWGGACALVLAAAYVIGIAVLVAVLDPGDTEGWSAAQKLGFALQHKAMYQAWMILIYVVAGAALVPLTVALHQRLAPGATALMQVASSFGLIWAGVVIASGMLAIVGLEAVARLQASDAAQAASMWATLGVVQDGLGGGVEFLGGVWVLLVSIASRRGKVFAFALDLIGFVVAFAGILTVIPMLGELAAVFGLGQIVWFTWLGIVMLMRTRRGPPAARARTP